MTQQSSSDFQSPTVQDGAVDTRHHDSLCVAHLTLDRWLLLHCQPGGDDHADGEPGKCFSAGLADQLN